MMRHRAEKKIKKQDSIVQRIGRNEYSRTEWFSDSQSVSAKEDIKKVSKDVKVITRKHRAVLFRKCMSTRERDRRVLVMRGGEKASCR